jgi:hypothetical protein
MFTTSCFAISDPKYKTNKDLYMESDALVWTPPTWFAPAELRNASEDLNYRLKVLPYKQDRNAQRYLVIPQLGLISPIILLDSNG